MRLDVPLVRQPKNSVHCGLAGVRMLLLHYGRDISLERLASDLKVHKIGTYAPQLGSYLIRQGFDVEIVTMHPGLFTLHDKGLHGKDILPRFRQLRAKTKDKIALDYFIKYLNDGGRIRVKVPDGEDIRAELAHGRPVCALITSQFLVGDKPRFNFHFNLITGIDSRYVYVNDPRWDGCGGRKCHRISEFLYGLYASAYGDFDNASLMKVKMR